MVGRTPNQAPVERCLSNVNGTHALMGRLGEAGPPAKHTASALVGIEGVAVVVDHAYRGQVE